MSSGTDQRIISDADLLRKVLAAEKRRNDAVNVGVRSPNRICAMQHDAMVSSFDNQSARRCADALAGCQSPGWSSSGVAAHAASSSSTVGLGRGFCFGLLRRSTLVACGRHAVL